jgi:serine/threonine-protein kinase RsbT
MSHILYEIAFRLQLRDESDVAAARHRSRELTQGQGQALSKVEALATAVSEVTRNVIEHADDGEVLLGIVRDGHRTGVIVIVRDSGPGISNIDDAMQDGFSTRTGLGLGLPGARRLVDDFELRSAASEGTTVTLRQWAP